MSDSPTSPEDHDHERQSPGPTDASGTGGGRPGDEHGAGDRPGPGDERGPGGGPEPGGDETEIPLPQALAAVVPGLRPAHPPRRTGVFVDPVDLREHVGELLRAILGGYEVDAFGNYTFQHEGARIFVTVGPSPIGPQVGVFSVTNLDVELTPPLADFLLTTNHTLGFGSFSYDRDNSSVWLRHTLLGTTLDGPELQSAVAAVATTAAQVDDAIKQRFGGRTFAEAPDEVQRRTQPPEPEPGPTTPPNASGYL